MYKVTREIHFCYGHRLLNYSGKCRHLHGHNGKVEIELFSEKLNDLGMVRDFEEIKSIVQVWIDENNNSTYAPGEKHNMTAVDGNACGFIRNVAVDPALL